MIDKISLEKGRLHAFCHKTKQWEPVEIIHVFRKVFFYDRWMIKGLSPEGHKLYSQMNKNQVETLLKHFEILKPFEKYI